MDQASVDVIGQERATLASFHPTRTEHEVVHDQLAPAIEQVCERHLAVRSVEQIVLLHFDPWQFAAAPAQLITLPREFFLLGKKSFARFRPFFARYYIATYIDAGHYFVPLCLRSAFSRTLVTRLFQPLFTLLG